MALLARALAADESSASGTAIDHHLGIVDAQSILGPFRDTGGALDVHDGPEKEAAPLDPTVRYDWGSYRVAWRDISLDSLPPKGSPSTSSCSRGPRRAGLPRALWWIARKP